ncbi:type II toxin-antitoxin system VapB family antitoxin [Agrococcus sp. ARC_14]|uniref:type II toxin-antitoxin system VapB family antitoxin n=1 Tax=Agrococcus sp. ARC_14 TaxID=2919927 RepID=UPI001F0590D1|nr:type II toxin-antitoxin system VapB family antitoxin [Agrococcus sp. ARC_14]
MTIDDELLARASELTGETERSALLRAGLTTLIRVESARRLAALGGADPAATAGGRRRGDAA